MSNESSTMNIDAKFGLVACCKNDIPLTETVCATLLVVMREAMDEVVKRGVPPAAARDFLLGHINVLASVIFKEREGAFSDACNKAIEFGMPALMRPDWKRVFEPEEIAASVQRIT